MKEKTLVLMADQDIVVDDDADEDTNFRALTQRDPRLEAEIVDDLLEARKLSEATKAPARVFRKFL